MYNITIELITGGIIILTAISYITYRGLIQITTKNNSIIIHKDDIKKLEIEKIKGMKKVS